MNNIGDSGASSIGELLAINIKLDTLRLEWNLIRAKGAEALAEGLAINASLVRHYFFYNCSAGSVMKQVTCSLCWSDS